MGGVDVVVVVVGISCGDNGGDANPPGLWGTGRK